MSIHDHTSAPASQSHADTSIHTTSLANSNATNSHGNSELESGTNCSNGHDRIHLIENVNGRCEVNLESSEQVDSYDEDDGQENEHNKGSRNDNGNIAHDERDEEGISLLAIIFPDASRDELEEMHFGRIHAPPENDVANHEPQPAPVENHLVGPTRSLGSEEHSHSPNQSDDEKNFLEHDDCGNNERNLQEKMIKEDELPSMSPPKNSIPKMTLPDDFLRIPEHQALKLPNKERSGEMEWSTVANLEHRVVQAHMANDDEMYHVLRGSRSRAMIRSTVLRRSYNKGLGIQLCEWNGFIYVNALTASSNANANRITDEESYQAAVQSGIGWNEFGPAFQAGLKPRDQILGFNGIPFLRRAQPGPNSGHAHGQRVRSSSGVLADAVNLIRGVDPIVFHIYRVDRRDWGRISDTHIHAEEYAYEQIQPRLPTQLSKKQGTRSRQSDDDSWTTQSDISIEQNGWQMVDDRHTLPGSEHYHSYNRRDPNEIHPLIQQFELRGLAKSKKEQVKLSKELQLLTSRAAMWDRNTYLRLGSSPRALYGERFTRDKLQYPGSRQGYSIGGIDVVRQALCIHIVNIFIEKDRLAYTIWVFDVESGTEWYAPIRYFIDFQELRMATSLLNKSIGKLPFPNVSWFNEDESSLSQQIKDTRCRQLQEFLRGLCNLVYTENIDESTSEIALFVQTFLGCDTEINSEHDFRRNHIDFHFRGSKSETETKSLLKKALQLYTYRLFLLPTFKTLVARFIDDVGRRAVLIEEKKRVSAGSNVSDKEKIIVELATINQVFGNIWELIYKGCLEDVNAIASCPEFSSLISKLTQANRVAFIEGIYREAVREQIEIEVYVPLRSIISGLLVYGWRYDDKSIAYKIEILKRKSQSFFKIKVENQSQSRWQSVIDILSEGVGRSTLPCNKLKAIVDAGNEVSRLSKAEHPRVSGDVSLGADDFLPIFIFCVVNADIERPCALCKFVSSSLEIAISIPIFSLICIFFQVPC